MICESTNRDLQTEICKWKSANKSRPRMTVADKESDESRMKGILCLERAFSGLLGMFIGGGAQC